MSLMKIRVALHNNVNGYSLKTPIHLMQHNAMQCNALAVLSQRQSWHGSASTIIAAHKKIIYKRCYSRELHLLSQASRSRVVLELSVMEQTAVSERHRHAILVTRRRNFFILDGTTWLRNEFYSQLCRMVDGISEWEKCIRGDCYAI